MNFVCGISDEHLAREGLGSTTAAAVVKGGRRVRGIQKLTWVVASTAIIARRVFGAPTAA